MSDFDIRKGQKEITSITFAEPRSKCSTIQAYRIRQFGGAEGVIIYDTEYDTPDNDEGFVVVSTAEDADNLITALQEAIKLGWLK